MSIKDPGAPTGISAALARTIGRYRYRYRYRDRYRYRYRYRDPIPDALDHGLANADPKPRTPTCGH